MIAWGYCRARLGFVGEGRAVIAKAAELDSIDRFRAGRLLAVLDRGGADRDADDVVAARFPAQNVAGETHFMSSQVDNMVFKA